MKMFITIMKIYNIINYLDKHPGGRDILEEFKDKDITAIFDDIGHSDGAKRMMKKFLVNNEIEDLHMENITDGADGAESGAYTDSETSTEVESETSTEVESVDSYDSKLNKKDRKKMSFYNKVWAMSSLALLVGFYVYKDLVIYK